MWVIVIMAGALVAALVVARLVYGGNPPLLGSNERPTHAETVQACKTLMSDMRAGLPVDGDPYAPQCKGITWWPSSTTTL